MSVSMANHHRAPQPMKPIRRPRPPVPGWHVSKRPEGWLEMWRPWPGTNDVHPLAAHADWAGPVKLTERHGQVEQHVEFFLGPVGDVSLLDEESVQGLDDLLDQLVQLGASLHGQTVMNDWSPPPAEMVVAWLNEAGHETAIDKEKNIRLTLKRVGCEGEVRGSCGDGRLRFVMGLGHWPELDGPVESAMLRLAREVNAHSRLARIVHRSEGMARRFEAQVDLSGLPAGGDGNPHRERMWRGMVRLSMKGLELALRQLGLELPLLAEPRNRDLAELLKSPN